MGTSGSRRVIVRFSFALAAVLGLALMPGAAFASTAAVVVVVTVVAAAEARMPVPGLPAAPILHPAAAITADHPQERIARKAVRTEAMAHRAA